MKKFVLNDMLDICASTKKKKKKYLCINRSEFPVDMR